MNGWHSMVHQSDCNNLDIHLEYLGESQWRQQWMKGSRTNKATAAETPTTNQRNLLNESETPIGSAQVLIQGNNHRIIDTISWSTSAMAPPCATICQATTQSEMETTTRGDSGHLTIFPCQALWTARS